MARTVRSTQLETRAARLRLEPRRKPYRAATAKQGLHLGYRRIAKKNGSWVAFTYQGKAGQYAERAFAQADDYSDADGSEVLTYFQAMQRISDEAPPVRHGSAYTVRDVIDDYVSYMAEHRKSASDARSNLNAYLAPYFGDDRIVASLTSADFRAWQRWALAHKPRGRLKDGKQSAAALRKRAQARGKPVPPEPATVSPEEQLRRRKSRLNRIINDVHAALEHAADDESNRVTNREAWSVLQKYRGVDQPRIQWLTVEQAKRLTNACDPDFRRLVQAALLTGARYGELRRMLVRDFDSRSKTALVAESKSTKPRRLPLTDEGCQLFEALVAGKGPDDHVLVKTDGTPWQKSEQHRRIRAACAAARISVTFHGIRHAFASLLVTAGVPLAFVAEALGHADTRMVSKHYAHLAPSVVHAAIRANLPTFGIETSDKVRNLRQ